MDPKTAVIELRKRMSEVAIAEAVGSHQTTINRIMRGKMEAKWETGERLVRLARRKARSNGKTNGARRAKEAR